MVPTIKSRGFLYENTILVCLRDNSLVGNAIRDPREHLSCFYETCLICRQDGVIDSIKLRLFGFTLTGITKDSLQFLPSGTIQICSKLEDKFLEQYYTNSQFIERTTKVSSFEQCGWESLYDARERFKLLQRKCLVHNMDNIEQIQHFTRGLRGQNWFLIDASTGGTIRNKDEDEVKKAGR